MSLLTWKNTYEIRPDDSLPDASCKQFLEDLLRAVHDRLQRRRTSSASSTHSNHSQTQVRRVRSSTPKDDADENFDEDMRYVP